MSGLPNPRVILAGPHSGLLDPIEQLLGARNISVLRVAHEAELLANAAALAQVEVLCASGSLPIGRQILEAAPRLKAVISPFTGVDGFDIAAASELGIIIGNGPIPENYISMAEATIMLMLVCLYDLPGKERAARAGLAAGHHSRMAQGKTIGLFGYGRIAETIVERLRPWGVNFLATSRRSLDADERLRFVPLEELLQQSDVILVLAPLTSETRNILDARRLGMTKPSSILVAVSRGGIIDEAALYDLAKAGHFARVALDVFAQEPLRADHPLLELDNVTVTPHGIGHTRETLERLPAAGAQSILQVLDGKPPLYVVNPEVLENWASGQSRK